MEAGGKLGAILVYAARVIVTGCKANLLRQDGKLLDELTLGIGRKQCKVHLIGIRHGVTLGGTGKDSGKRHPTIGNNVLIGTGAKVLGPFKVGDNSRIAANSVVLREVPENATVVGVPGRIARISGEKLDHIHTPDPVMIEIEALKKRLEALENAAQTRE